MKKKITLFLLFLMPFFASAQKNTSRGIGIQTDILDPILAKGGSLWLNHRIGKHFKINLAAGINQAPFTEQSDLYAEKRQFFAVLGFGTYLLKTQKIGLYLGPELVYQNLSVESQKTDEKQSRQVFRIGPRLGMDWLPFENSGFYLTPYIGLRIAVSSSDEMVFNTVAEPFKFEKMSPIIGINVGWRFKFKNQN